MNEPEQDICGPACDAPGLHWDTHTCWPGPDEADALVRSVVEAVERWEAVAAFEAWLADRLIVRRRAA